MSDTETNDPELEDVIRAAVRSETAKIHTSTKGIVISYDRVKQSATIQPVIESAFYDGEALVQYLPEPIANVPVQFPGSNTFAITWELKAGDPVTLVFAERSLDEWKSTGKRDNKPQDFRRFDITDAQALPGGHSFSAPIGSNGVDAQSMVILGAMIKLGSSAASQAVALGPVTETFLATLIVELMAHVHPDPITGASGPPVVPFTAPSTGQFNATKVKAE